TRLVVADGTALPNVAAPTNTPPGVVVVTGGARGVTAASALALAARHGLRLALLGPTVLSEGPGEGAPRATAAETAAALVTSAFARGEALTVPQARKIAAGLMAEREVRATLAAAAEQGVVARYFSADITNPQRLRNTLGEVRDSLGPIVGVV